MSYVNQHRAEGHDVIVGASGIAKYLLGSANQRRKIYYLVEHNALPVFRLGAQICARQSTLSEWIAQQESAVYTADQF